MATPTSRKTAEFYNDLMKGDQERGILGKDTRYNSSLLIEKPSVQKYFNNVISEHLSLEDKVLDFGCGPGTFTTLAAQFCKDITGVDISQEFVSQSNRNFEQFKVPNASSIKVAPDTLPFDSNIFDVLLLVDVIHHFEDVDTTLSEAFRVLKPGGKILIFEPNKLNPLIWLVHYVDENERGLLKLGTPWSYRKVLSHRLNFKYIDFNGIVIGPQSRIFDLFSTILNARFLKPVIGWLNPKIFMVGNKI